MARKAKTEDEEQAIELQKPDFERALRIMTHDVKPAEEKNATARGDLSAAWKTIEDDCHCNKSAAKHFAKLLGMSEEARDDHLRTLYGLMRLSGIGVAKDLVDEMEGGEAPGMPVSAREPRSGLATLQPELAN